MKDTDFGTILKKTKLFLALSRTPHGLMDMATPVFAALVWLGEFPSVGVTLLGLVTIFAGYTTVYALNDLVDYRTDRKKAAKGVFDQVQGDLDAVLVRHPLALGLLTVREALLWAGAWGVITVLGALMLNPFCLLIFLAAVVLETVYCLLWNVSPARTLVSGVVKTLGSVAAIYGVDPSPSPVFVSALFLLLFFWEIGGQNIPNDWTDLDLDQDFKAKTLPIALGLDHASLLILWTNIGAMGLCMAVFGASKASFEIPYYVLALFVGGVLVVYPSFKLRKNPSQENAMTLFNRASFYPLGLLCVALIKTLT